jgi:bla regulator protein blaR1
MKSALWILLCTRALFAQPTFEVASIKPNTSGERWESVSPVTGGKLTAKNVTVGWLVKTAYHVEPFQIAGLPAWANTERFDVLARAADAHTTPEQLRQMIRTLLADRFQMAMHKENREQPTYSLVVARNGAKLKKAAKDVCAESTMEHPCGGFRIYKRSQMWGETVTVQQFAAELTYMMGRMVVDKTGIPGLFDIRVEWTPEQFGPEPGAEVKPEEANATLFTSVQEQLGLRLVSEKAPVETIVVDRVSRPAAN